MNLRELIYTKELTEETKFRLLQIVGSSHWIEDLIDFIVEMEFKFEERDKEISSLESDVNKEKEQARELLFNLKEAQQEKEVFSVELEKIKKQLEDSTQENNDLSEQLTKMEKMKEDSEKEIKNLQEEIEYIQQRHKIRVGGIEIPTDRKRYRGL